jgi:hypothetical protein
MSFLQELHSAHAERVARLSHPLPGARLPRSRPSVRIIPIVDGRQKIEVPVVVIKPTPFDDLTTEDIGRLLPERGMTVPRVVRAVAAEFGLLASDITGRKRTRHYVIPRQIAMYLARKLTNKLSLPHIGRRMGGFNHTTILHGIGRGEHYAALPEFAGRVAAIEAALAGGSP